MNSIIESLDKYEEGIRGAKTTLSKELVKLFHEEGDIIVDSANEAYTKETKTMINSLARRLTK